MHPELRSSSKVIRKGSYRFLGPVFLAMAGFAVFMISRDHSPSPVAWIAPPLFTLGGLWFLLSDSRYALFRNERVLIWVRYSGKKREEGRIDIHDICKVEIFRMRPLNKKVATALQVELVKADGGRYVLPRDIGLGGPGNPQYEDLVNDLKSVNPAVEVELLDVEGWRHGIKSEQSNSVFADSSLPPSITAVGRQKHAPDGATRPG